MALNPDLIKQAIKSKEIEIEKKIRTYNEKTGVIEETTTTETITIEKLGKPFVQIIDYIVDEIIKHIKTYAQISTNLTFSATGGLITGVGGGIPGPITGTATGVPFTGQAVSPPGAIQ